MVTLYPYSHEARREHQCVCQDLLDDFFLFVNIEAFEAVASERPLVADVLLEVRDVDPHRIDRHVLKLVFWLAVLYIVVRLTLTDSKPVLLAYYASLTLFSCSFFT
jgi:hypothetical protein